MNFIKVTLLFFLTIHLNANEMREYIEKREITEYVADAPDKKISTISSVTITERDNQIVFNISIMADNYHTCTLKGIAKIENGFYRYKEQFDNGKECLLTFNQKKN
ncbi:MAG: hypothetical protein U9N49_10045 [Campylobacterota bacterium]|nr:hypothetical protein [Campylobacterota bacterium]